MREIKFRGFNGEKWLFGNLNINYKAKHAAISDDEWWRHPVRFETVGQFTGLKDSRGVEIYEGDILDIDGTFIAEVVYACGSFDLYTKKEPLGPLSAIAYDCAIGLFSGTMEMVVIGNVYDNPELMRGKNAAV